MKKLLILTSILLSAETVISQQSVLMPSEAIALIYKAVDDNPNLKRIENTKSFTNRLITDNLDPLEQFFLGEVYFWNFKPNEAKEAFSKVLNESSLIANVARKRIWIININGFGLYDEVEKDLLDYQENIKPDPEDRRGAYFGISLLASKYKKDGNHEKVVELIDRELSRLDYSGAYSSFLLPTRFFESYVETGMDKKLKKRMNKVRAGLAAELERRKQNVPEKDFDHTVYCSTVNNMLTAVTEKLGYNQLNEKYEGIIDRLDAFMEAGS